MAREATYRFDVFTSIASVLVRVYLLRMVWVALYARNAAPASLPLHAIITYSTVALLMGLVMDIDQTRALHDKLHDGSIATDFMKPIIVPLYFFADGTGEVLFHAALIVPSLLFALLICAHRRAAAAACWPRSSSASCWATWSGSSSTSSSTASRSGRWRSSAVQLIVTWVTDLFGGELIPLVHLPGGSCRRSRSCCRSRRCSRRRC